MNQPNFDLAVPARPPGSILPPGNQWVGHVGTNQRRRQMRQRCAAVMKSNVPEIKATVARLAAVCDGGLDDPYAELYPMICEAMSETVVEQGEWVDIVNRQLDQFEAQSPTKGEQR